MTTRRRFYSKVRQIIDWQVVSKILKSHLGQPCSATGSPVYPRLKMLKTILLQIWHNLSDRETEYALQDRISFRGFSSFHLNSDTPSHSTICRFRNNMINSGADVVLFKLINSSLEKFGLITKKGITIDSTIIKSSRRPRKIIDINTTGTTSIIYSDDKDASWSAKANKYHYGYKLHMITDINHGFIIDGKITPANCADTTEILPIVKGIPLEKKL